MVLKLQISPFAENRDLLARRFYIIAPILALLTYLFYHHGMTFAAELCILFLFYAAYLKVRLLKGDRSSGSSHLAGRDRGASHD